MSISNVATKGKQKLEISGTAGFLAGSAASSLKTSKGNENLSSKTLYLEGCKTLQPIQAEKKTKSEKLAAKRQTQRTLVKLLHRIQENELADKFNRCSQNFSFKTCGKSIIDPRADYRCEQYKWCPFCARRRANRLCNKYLPFATLFERRSMQYIGVKVTPCHLVLTQAQVKGETAVESHQRLYDSISKKLIRRPFFKKNFAGGIGSFEVTVSNAVDRNGLWHFHAHITVFRVGYWGKETGKLDTLKQIWAEVSPNAKNLYLGVIDDINRKLPETIKYGMKPADVENLSGDQMKQLLKLKGKKMTFTFGSFKKFCKDYKLTLDEKTEFTKEIEDYTIRDENGEFIGYKPCPCCGKTLFETKLSTSNLIQFVRNIESIPNSRGKPFS
jgi:hypothetical protein